MMVLKSIVRPLGCLALLLTLSPPPRQTSLAQSTRRHPQRPTPIEILDANREQDGLRGSVSRVRTEVAPVSVTAGTVVEGRRALLEVTRYDPAGKRVENKTYPVINTPADQETHKYDGQGNLVETVARDAQGAVLRRTVYEYEYDPVGNWTKMTALVAVGEPGGERLEPREVTYRAIAYYDTGGSVTSEVPDDARAADSDGQPAPAPEDAPHGSPEDSSAAAAAEASPPADGDAIEVGPINEMALSLPPPSYPVEGRRLPVAIKVSVEVVIDQTGRILSARAADGPARLRGAAEDAARAAIFMPFKVQGVPIKVKGLLVYNFPFGR